MLFAMALALAASGACGAFAADVVQINCVRSGAFTAGWDEPLQVTYSGDESGTLAIASTGVALSLPANKQIRTGELDGKPHSVTYITGNADTEALMPNLAALEACAASHIQPEFKDDPDMYELSVRSCLDTTPATNTPIPVSASFTIVLVPQSNSPHDVIFEIKRTYAEKSVAPGSAMTVISTAACSLLLD